MYGVLLLRIVCCFGRDSNGGYGKLKSTTGYSGLNKSCCQRTLEKNQVDDDDDDHGLDSADQNYNESASLSWLGLSS
jgi:hypothetical protein